MKEELVVEQAAAGRRLDSYLADRADGLSRTQAQKLIAEGSVLVNRALCCDKNYRLAPADVVLVTMPDPEPYRVNPEPITLDILYEDSDLLVINKPRGMVVHPAPGHRQGTLVNALLHYCNDLSGIGGLIRPGIVHRLDKDTTGLLIIAKDDAIHQALAGQLKERRLRRDYLALVHGIITPQTGKISAPVGRHPVYRQKMAVVPGGREAVTCYRVAAVLGRFTLVRISLETGRTHQIRVHMASLGHPVVGDLVYGRKELPHLIRGQALHAHRLAFIHPRTGLAMQLSAPLPNDFREALRCLRKPGCRNAK